MERSFRSWDICSFYSFYSKWNELVKPIILSNKVFHIGTFSFFKNWGSGHCWQFMWFVYWFFFKKFCRPSDLWDADFKNAYFYTLILNIFRENVYVAPKISNFDALIQNWWFLKLNLHSLEKYVEKAYKSIEMNKVDNSKYLDRSLLFLLFYCIIICVI